MRLWQFQAGSGQHGSLVITARERESETMRENHESVTRTTRTRPGWQTPDCEQISVSAEASAYMGARTDWE